MQEKLEKGGYWESDMIFAKYLHMAKDHNFSLYFMDMGQCF